MNIKKHIPNAITLGNLFCGCVAILKIMNGNLVAASAMVGLAIVFDFFDGFVARLLKVSSNIGKDLDSLADMVSFGVVPGLMMHSLIINSLMVNNFYFQVETNAYWFYLPYFGFTITLFSALRLAKFNNDIRQSDSFIGLPTPANTMLIAAIPIIILNQDSDNFLAQFLTNAVCLISITILCSYLLVAELPLFALKFKKFSWRENKLKYVFLLISLLLIVIIKFTAIPIIILFYILLSIVNNIFLKPNH